MKRDFANPLCIDCGAHLYRNHEYSYIVTDRVWKQALRCSRRLGKVVSTYDMLCIGCLEKRLNRILDKHDFDWSVPLNTFPDKRSNRLLSRMQST